MKRLVANSSLAFVLMALFAALAQAAGAAPTVFTGNVGLASDYRFRGITQTFGEPAIQGGVDYAHSSGLYLGNWNSNVSETAGFPGGNLEMDFYGGWRKSRGDWGGDVGLLYYYYPGSNAAGGGALGALANPNRPGATSSGTVHNSELYVAGSWRFITLKYSRSFSDYFLVPDTRGSYYLDLSASYDLGGGWGVNGHLGHMSVKNFGDASYTDYKLGLTKDLGGWLLGASLVATNAKDDCAGAGNQPYCFAKPDGGGSSTYAGGKTAVVLSIGRSF